MSAVIDAIIRLRDQFTPTLRRARDELNRLSATNAKASRSITGVGDSINAVSEKLAPLAIGITGAVGGAVLAFSDLDDAARKVQTRLDESDWNKMPQIKQQAMELSLHYKQSAQDIYAIQENIASAGFSAAQVLDTTEGILRGVDASGAQAETVANAVTTALIAFKLNAKDTNMIVDQLVMASNASKSSVDELGECFKYCAGTAANLHMSLSETNAALAIMANNGADGTTAGTNLDALLGKLTDAKVKASLEDMGIQVADAQGNFVGLIKVIGQLDQKFKGMGDVEKQGKLRMLFQDQGGRAAIALMNGGVEAFIKMEKQIKESAGVSEKAAAVLNGGLSAQMAIFKNTIIYLGVAFAELLLPQLTALNKILQNIAQAIKNLTPEQKQLVINIGEAVLITFAFTKVLGTFFTTLGAIGKTCAGFNRNVAMIGGLFGFIKNKVLDFVTVLKVIFLTLTTIGNSIKNTFAPVANIIKYVFLNPVATIKTFFSIIRTGFIGLRALLFTNPIGLALLGITIAINAVITHWDKFKAAFERIYIIAAARLQHLYTVVSIILTNIYNKIKVVFPTIAKIIGVVFAFVANIITMDSKTIQFILNILVLAFDITFTTICGVIEIAFKVIAGVIDTGINIISGIITFLTGVFTGNWAQAWEGIKTIFTSIFYGIAGICTSVMDSIKGTINSIISSINGISLTVPDWVPSFGGKQLGTLNIPLLFTGAENWKGGLAKINDQGGEIVDLPYGTRVMPHDKSIKEAYKMGQLNVLKDAFNAISIPKINNVFTNKINATETYKILLDNTYKKPNNINNTNNTNNIKNNSNSNISINISRLADNIVVRQEADIDTITDKLVFKLKSYAINSMQGAI